MIDNYYSILRALKESFYGSEKKLIAKAIKKIFPNNTPLKTLDIGSGDLSGIIKLGIALQQFNIHLEIDAIDISNPKPSLSYPGNIKIKRIIGDFMKLNLEKQYDLVFCCQALYYLGDPEQVIRRMMSYVKPKGRLVIVVWDEGCFLRDLHKSIHPNSISSNLCQRYLEGLNKVLNLEASFFTFEGTFDPMKYKDKNGNMASLSHFILREEFTSKRNINILTKKLNHIVEKVPRSNVIAFFKDINA